MCVVGKTILRSSRVGKIKVIMRTEGDESDQWRESFVFVSVSMSWVDVWVCVGFRVSGVSVMCCVGGCCACGAYVLKVCVHVRVCVVRCLCVPCMRMLCTMRACATRVCYACVS